MTKAEVLTSLQHIAEFGKFHSVRKVTVVYSGSNQKGRAYMLGVKPSKNIIDEDDYIIELKDILAIFQKV